MGKISEDFNPDAYAPVADRIRLFYQEYPGGRIRTVLVSRTEREVVFEARVYRGAQDSEPAATGWAAEREGDGDINTVALRTPRPQRSAERSPTSASRLRVSGRVRRRWRRCRGRAYGRWGCAPVIRETTLITKEQRANGITFDLRAAIVADLLHLLARAERCGVRTRRIAAWRERLQHGSASVHTLGECERRLRAWLSRHDPSIDAK